MGFFPSWRLEKIGVGKLGAGEAPVSFRCHGLDTSRTPGPARSTTVGNPNLRYLDKWGRG